MRKLGIATIGQAPRDDIVALFRRFVPPGTEVALRGCLDGLGRTDIAARPPGSGADTLYTRLPTGDAIISKKHVIERAPATLAALRRDGCDAIVFACTGDFPPMEGDAGVLFPSRVLNGLAQALLPRGRLGLLVPLAEQREKLAAKWARPGLDIVAEALRPSAGLAAAEDAARKLAALKPDLVAMDCMSYTPETKETVRRTLEAPTLLAITATGRVIEELLS
jgi:protein AroM